jgi:dihydrofolate reductase
MNNSKLILYIATSLDGYIAKPGEDLSFLDCVQKEGEDYGYTRFIETVHTVILGRKTYDWVLQHAGSFPHADKETYVITRQTIPDKDNVKFYSGNLKDLIYKLKQQQGKHIFCDGGAELINAFLKEKLFDELIISIIPILVGDGILLFKDGRPEQYLELVSNRSFETGLIQLHYKIKA